LKGLPSALILPFNLFFSLKHEFYSIVSGKEAYLVASPFIVKAFCRAEPLLLSVPPGSLVTYEEEAIEVGACIADEYFWFEGWRLGWEVGRVPEWLREDSLKAGFRVGKGRFVVPISGAAGEVELLRPWHPAARALEEGEPCEGGRGEGVPLAACGGSDLLVDGGEMIYLGRVDPWRALPVVAYASRL